MRGKILDKRFFSKSAEFVAPKLLGKIIVRRLGTRTFEMMITETEAYLGEKDMASHARFGKTRRNSVMFENGGIWYVYFVYGMHWLLNIVTGGKERPSAVLIRKGIVLGKKPKKLNGPAKITKFLKVDGKFSGKPSSQKTGLWLKGGGIKIKTSDIKRFSRVGVGYAGKWAGKKLRFTAPSLSLKKALGT